MKKFLAILAALTFVALPLTLTAQQYTAFSGVSLLTTVPATKTVTSAPLRLPTFSGVGTLNVTEAGITGSPSGCTIALSYVQNNALSSAVIAAQTVSFTPSTGVQQFNINPGTAEGDQYVATYACSNNIPCSFFFRKTFIVSSTIRQMNLWFRNILILWTFFRPKEPAGRHIKIFHSTFYFHITSWTCSRILGYN